MLYTLVVHTGGIGDFLLACPAIARLGQDGPVELLGRKERLALAVAGGLARAAYDLDGADFASVFTAPSNQLKAFLARFDQAVIWMRDEGGDIERAFGACGIGAVRCFPGLPPEDWSRHASEYFLDCIGAPPAPPLRLCLPHADAALDVVLHPGSGSARKNWPIERFAHLARVLAEQGRHVTWLMGPAEEDMTLPPGAEVFSCTSLVDLGRALQDAALYVGNDSGITHLAAAVGCPCIAVFGPTNPAVWAPRGAHVWIHRDVW